MSAITSATQTPIPPVASVTAPAAQAAAPAGDAKDTPLPRDVVHVSAAALAMQEAAESPAQTAKEAGAGDSQAKQMMVRQVAKHAAVHHAATHPAHVVK